jgi:hypothetical protein
MFSRLCQTLGAILPAGAARAGLQTADDGARIVSQEWLDTGTFDFTVDSPAIGSDQKVRVLVPNGWSAQSARTWPVLYAFRLSPRAYATAARRVASSSSTPETVTT